MLGEDKAQTELRTSCCMENGRNSQRVVESEKHKRQWEGTPGGQT